MSQMAIRNSFVLLCRDDNGTKMLWVEMALLEEKISALKSGEPA